MRKKILSAFLLLWSNTIHAQYHSSTGTTPSSGNDIPPGEARGIPSSTNGLSPYEKQMNKTFKISGAMSGSGSVVFVPEGKGLPTGYYFATSAHVLGDRPTSNSSSNGVIPGSSYSFKKEIQISNPNLEAAKGGNDQAQAAFTKIPIDKVYTSDKNEIALVPITPEIEKKVFTGAHGENLIHDYSFDVPKSLPASNQAQDLKSTGWGSRQIGSGNYPVPMRIESKSSIQDSNGYSTSSNAATTDRGEAIAPSSSMEKGPELYSNSENGNGVRGDVTKKSGTNIALTAGISGGPVTSSQSEFYGVNTAVSSKGDAKLKVSSIRSVLSDPKVIYAK